MTPLGIKELLELTSETYDIGQKTRREEYVLLRMVYYKLCRRFCDKKLYTLSDIGRAMGERDHATVLHGLKSFADLTGQKTFKDSDKIYRIIHDVLIKKPIKLNTKSKQKLTLHYRVKYIRLTEKYRNVVNSLAMKINELRHEKIHQELESLNELNMYRKIPILEELLSLENLNQNKLDYVIRNFIHKTKTDNWKNELNIK